MPKIKLSKQSHSDLIGLLISFREIMNNMMLNNNVPKREKKLYEKASKNANKLLEIIKNGSDEI